MDQPITELRSRVKEEFDRLPFAQREQAASLIGSIGLQFIRGLSEPDFLLCLKVGWEDQLIPLLAPAIPPFLAQQDVSQLNGIPVEFLQQGLLAMIAYWFQQRVNPD